MMGQGYGGERRMTVGFGFGVTGFEDEGKREEYSDGGQVNCDFGRLNWVRK